jgi:hypothetical protein
MTRFLHFLSGRREAQKAGSDMSWIGKTRFYSALLDPCSIQG